MLGLIKSVRECSPVVMWSPSLAVSSALLAALALLVAVYTWSVAGKSKKGRKLKGVESHSSEWNPPSGPRPLPLLGSLHLLGRHEIPFAAFTELRRDFGDVFSVRLGSTDCVVLNNPELRDEALLTKGNDFDGRPNFNRFIKLFGDEKQHSLAFCDWDHVQATRRELLQHYTLPHSYSSNWRQMADICLEECEQLVEHVRGTIGEQDGEATVDIRPLIMKSCANIFNRYFCSCPRFDYADAAFSDYVDNFDQIFLEVNTGRLPDFIPALTPVAFKHIYDSRQNAKCVRRFVDDVIIAGRKEELRENSNDDGESPKPGNFLDAIMPFLDGEKSCANPDGSYNLDREGALYTLEDILGGFCAVGSMAARFVKDLAANQDAQEQVANEAIRLEQDDAENRPAHSLSNAASLHWGRAAMFETFRLTCSPIVPHRATKDSNIGGYDIKKDTVVFINNHHMSFDESYWSHGDTERYIPARFLKEENANRNAVDGDQSSPADLRFFRPKHFKPFSQGKRSCMGYKLVENVCLVLTVALVRAFRIRDGEPARKIPPGILATPIHPLWVNVSNRA